MNKNWLLELLIGIFWLLFIIILFDRPFLNAQNCIDNYQCGPGQYCKKQEGDCFGWGGCSDMPSSCSYAGYDIMPTPVCGCNNITYSDSCDAARAGVNVAYSGQCQTSSTTLTNLYLQSSSSPMQIWCYPYWQNGYPYWQNEYYYYPYWENWDSQNYPFLQNWSYRYYPYLPHWQHLYGLKCYYPYGWLYGGGLYAGLYGL